MRVGRDSMRSLRSGIDTPICVVFFAVVVCLVTPTDVCSQGVWEKTSGPPGIEVTVIYKANGTLFAGTKTQGLFRSTDSGTTWTPSGSGISRTHVRDIITSGENLLIATSATNCPASTNVFKSTDNGVTWTPTTGLAGRVVSSFAKKGDILFAVYNSFGAGTSVFRSVNNGNSWQPVTSPLQLATKVFASDEAVIVGERNVIWRSTDDGVTWSAVEQSGANNITSFGRAGGRLFAGTSDGYHISDNNGENWTFIPFPGGVASFASDGSNIYLGTRDKIYRSSNLGANWTETSSGLGKGLVGALMVDGATLFAGTPEDASGIYRSVNSATTWVPVANGLPTASRIRSIISFGSHIFAGTDGDGVYRSGDRGITWTKTDAANPLIGHQRINSFCVKGNALYVGAENGIFRSTDAGSTFVPVMNGFPPNTGGVSVHSLTVSGSNIVAGATVRTTPNETLNPIFYSADDGATWQQSALPALPTVAPFVASDGGIVTYAAVVASGFGNSGVYKSIDNGITWVSRTNVLTADLVRIGVKANNVLASTSFDAFYSPDFGEFSWTASSLPGSQIGGGVNAYTFLLNSVLAGNEGMYISANGGATWSPFSIGFPVCPVPSVHTSAVDSAYVYAGTDGDGVWRRRLGTPLLPQRAPFDFDGDNRTDVAVFRPTGDEWWVNRSSDQSVFATRFGSAGDQLAPADYTGDGKTDIAFWRPSTGEWFVVRSEDLTFFAFPFGIDGDIPVPADYDDDGVDDAAVFRSGTWFVRRSSDGRIEIEQFGAAGDRPVPADFDGQNGSDIAIHRPSSGEWWIKYSGGEVAAVAFGISSDTPVPGDYTGDGRSDIAFWRQSTGEWFVLRSEDTSFYFVRFGFPTDIIAPGDYDGDGRFDTTVFRPSNATWYSQRSTTDVTIQPFGSAGDRPIPNAFVGR